MWALVAAVLVISVASSTSAQHAEARERLAKFTNRFWVPTVMVWAVLISGIIARG